jgi:hypothetical protein
VAVDLGHQPISQNQAHIAGQSLKMVLFRESADAHNGHLGGRRENGKPLSSGQGEIAETIFHRGGKHLEKNYIPRVFKRLLAKSGLREIPLPDIRHPFASLLLSDGGSPV